MVVDTLIYHPTLSKLIKFGILLLKERKLLDYYHIYQDFLVIMLIKKVILKKQLNCGVI